MSVLAALALPAYQQQQRQARRGDGQAALLQLQMDQARWRSAHDNYTDTLGALGWTSDRSAQGHYQISITEATADSYTIEAAALGAQAADRDCNPLRLSWQGSATAVERGETLTGLLVGLSVGLVVLAAGSALLANHLRGHRMALQDSHLHHDLRSAMDWMSRELRKAQYSAK
eukprot:gene7117-6960_t